MNRAASTVVGAAIVVLTVASVGGALALETREIDPQDVVRPQVVVVGFQPAPGSKANRQVTYSGILKTGGIAGCREGATHVCEDADIQLELLLDLAKATPDGPRRWTDRQPGGQSIPTVSMMVFQQGAAVVSLADIESLGPGGLTPNWAVDDAWVDIQTVRDVDTQAETKRLLLHAIINVRGAHSRIDKLAYSATIGSTFIASRSGRD